MIYLHTHENELVKMGLVNDKSYELHQKVEDNGVVLTIQT